MSGRTCSTRCCRWRRATRWACWSCLPPSRWCSASDSPGPAHGMNGRAVACSTGRWYCRSPCRLTWLPLFMSAWPTMPARCRPAGARWACRRRPSPNCAACRVRPRCSGWCFIPMCSWWCARPSCARAARPWTRRVRSATGRCRPSSARRCLWRVRPGLPACHWYCWKHWPTSARSASWASIPSAPPSTRPGSAFTRCRRRRSWPAA